MNKTNSAPGEQKRGRLVKLALEAGPVVVYSVVYLFSGWLVQSDIPPIMIATACFIASTLIAVVVSTIKLGRLPVAPLATALPLIAMGGAGLILNDATFIKVRPTVINFLFAIILLGGLGLDKALFRYIFSMAFELSEEGWRALTLRWGIFCLLMAALNEVTWRTMPETVWVIYDAWVSTALTIAFAIAQYSVLTRYEVTDQPDEPGSA